MIKVGELRKERGQRAFQIMITEGQMHFRKSIIGCGRCACGARGLRKERRKGNEWWNEEIRELI